MGEQVRADAAKVNLVALASAADSAIFWTERLKGLLRLPNMPTALQVCVAEVEGAVEKVTVCVDWKGFSVLGTLSTVGQPWVVGGTGIVLTTVALRLR